MADASLNESGESVEIIGEKQPRYDTLPTDESIEDADDSEDSSEEDSDEDSGEEKPVAVAKAKNVAPTVEAAPAASASKPKEVAPRRSRRSNFGNRYEDTLKKEKEEDRMPTSLRNGSLLGGWIFFGDLLIFHAYRVLVRLIDWLIEWLTVDRQSTQNQSTAVKRFPSIIHALRCLVN